MASSSSCCSDVLESLVAAHKESTSRTSQLLSMLVERMKDVERELTHLRGQNRGMNASDTQDAAARLVQSWFQDPSREPDGSRKGLSTRAQSVLSREPRSVIDAAVGKACSLVKRFRNNVAREGIEVIAMAKDPLEARRGLSDKLNWLQRRATGLWAYVDISGFARRTVEVAMKPLDKEEELSKDTLELLLAVAGDSSIVGDGSGSTAVAEAAAGAAAAAAAAAGAGGGGSGGDGAGDAGVEDVGAAGLPAMAPLDRRVRKRRVDELSMPEGIPSAALVAAAAAHASLLPEQPPQQRRRTE
eukprot:PLAT4534.1.p1 GENE.PLAT4534.1~~PLAT4534.1.p1  ORF type:complete len:301 (+),score=108.40 PLAT4534.1:74-976(+)